MEEYIQLKIDWSQKGSLSRAAPALVRSNLEMIFSAWAWIRLIGANVRSSFRSFPCPPLISKHMRHSIRTGQGLLEYVRLKSLVLKPQVDLVMADKSIALALSLLLESYFSR